MIRYVRNNYLSRQKYDHCVRMDSRGLVYAYSWYLDEVCHHWDCLVLDDYDAVMPLPHRQKMGLKYFYRPFGIQQLGIFHKTEISEETIAQFLSELRKHCRFADVYLNENQEPLRQNSAAYKSDPNSNLVVDLNRTFREIYHNYSKHTQRNIVKASKNKLQIFEHDDPQRLIDLFKLNRGEDLKLDSEFYRNMAKAMYNCLHKGLGKVWTVYDERNNLCAGIYIVETDSRHTLLFSASSAEGKELRAMFYLINEYLIFSSGTKKVFDFEGSNLPGLKRFYQGFGAQELLYYRLVYNGLPWPLSLLKSN